MWWGNTAKWKDAEKHWRGELKEQGLEQQMPGHRGPSQQQAETRAEKALQEQLLLCNHSELQLHW